MNLIENSDEIIVRHIPVREWIIGGILILVYGGFYIWLVYSAMLDSGIFNESSTKVWFGLLPILIFAAAIILISVFDISLNSMMFAPLTTVIISEKTKSVDIIYQRFYGSKVKRHFFHNVEKFKSYKRTVNFSSGYFLALVLVNRKIIKLKIPIGKDKQVIIKFIKKLNKFMKSKDLQRTVSNN
jgi:hypothetical protein